MPNHRKIPKFQRGCAATERGGEITQRTQRTAEIGEAGKNPCTHTQGDA